MSAVKQQINQIGIGHFKEAIGFGFGLYAGAHVVMIGKFHAFVFGNLTQSITGIGEPFHSSSVKTGLASKIGTGLP